MNCLPSTTVVAGHWTGVVGVRPARSRASEVTALKVEPGANWPKVAWFCPPVPEPLAAARIAPSLGRTATRALAGRTPAEWLREEAPFVQDAEPPAAAFSSP